MKTSRACSKSKVDIYLQLGLKLDLFTVKSITKRGLSSFCEGTAVDYKSTIFFVVGQY